MITYENSKSRPIAIGVVVAAVLAGGAYWWVNGRNAGDGASSVKPTESKGGFTAWQQASTGTQDSSTVAALPKPPVLEDGRPSDVQPDDWNALNSALAKVGAPKNEAERIVNYLRYQHGFEAWQSVDVAKEPMKRRSMAQGLLSEIPARLANGEFTPVEATLMSAVLMADLEQDETKRAQRLEEWQSKLNTISSPNEDEQKAIAKQREIELKRRQATAFAEWQARTSPADRTPAKLEQSMAEIRRAYNSGEF